MNGIEPLQPTTLDLDILYLYGEVISLVKVSLLDQTISENALKILQLTVNDLKKTDVETFKTKFTEVIKQIVKTSSIVATQESLRKSGVTLDQIKDISRKKFDEYIEARADTVAQFRLKGLNDGQTFFQTLNSTPPPGKAYLFEKEDFTGITAFLKYDTMELSIQGGVYDDFFPLVKESLLDPSIADNDLKILQLTIKDLKTEDVEKFKSKFLDIIKRVNKKSLIERIELNVQQSGVSLDQLTEAGRKKFDEFVTSHLEKVMQKSTKGLDDGLTFDKIFNSSYLGKNHIFDPQDFTGMKIHRYYSSQAQVDSLTKKQDARLTLQSKMLIKQLKKGDQQVKDLGGRCDILLKIYKLIFNETGKSVKDIPPEELIDIIPIYELDVKERDLQKKKEISERLTKELLLDEEKTEKKSQRKTPQQGKTKRKQASGGKKAPTAPPITEDKETKESDVAKKSSAEFDTVKLTKVLNSKHKTPYKLHPRILRWNVGSLSQIKTFKDKDEKGTLVSPYADLSENELLEQQAYHNLSGIERLLSNKEICDAYSFPYTFKSKDTKFSEEKVGICFYAEMQYLGKSTQGLIHIGIGKDNVIFHAMFTPLKEEQKVEMDDIFLVMENTEIPEESGWTNVSASAYEMLSNETLAFKVDRQKVTFILHPLI